jgi:hypothetical protein
LGTPSGGGKTLRRDRAVPATALLDSVAAYAVEGGAHGQTKCCGGVKAVIYGRYGGPEVLRLEDMPTPSPVVGQVLVKVAATSIKLSDWECLRGSPAYARIGALRSPVRRTLGSDFAGVVEAVGDGVTRFRAGEEVYGDNLALKGGFADYAVAPGRRRSAGDPGTATSDMPKSASGRRRLCVTRHTPFRLTRGVLPRCWSILRGAVRAAGPPQRLRRR